MPHTDHTTTSPSPIAPNEGAIRSTIAVGLLGIALVHVIDGIGKWSEVRYEFWLFMALVVSSTLLAGAVLFTRHRLVMPAVIGLVASSIVAYVLSRTTGLPNSTDDIGNWTETIGVVNLFVEGATLAVAVGAQATLGRAEQPELATRRAVATSAGELA